MLFALHRWAWIPLRNCDEIASTKIKALQSYVILVSFQLPKNAHVLGGCSMGEDIDNDDHPIVIIITIIAAVVAAVAAVLIVLGLLGLLGLNGYLV